MAKGQKTGGRQKGSRNKRTQEREEATAQAIALIGEAIPDAFAGDAHAFLVAVYKNPKFDHHTRQDAAKAALPYEKPRLQAVTLANQGAEPVKVRSELRDRAPAGLRARADRPWRGEGEDAEGRASIGWSRGP